MFNRKTLILSLLVLAMAFFWILPTRAFENRAGDTVVIEADEVIDDDLYVTARILELDGTVNGDLIFLGQQATIRGTVAGDFIAAGQNFIIQGELSDDARIAAYAMTVEGTLGDDLVAAGFSLEHKDNAEIGGDLLFAGYQALVSGDVEENLQIGGGAVNLQGQIGGSAKVDVGGSGQDGAQGMPPGFPFFPGLPSVPSVPPGLTLDESASIEGNLEYIANEKVSIPSGVVEGNVSFSQYIPQTPQEAQEPTPLEIIGKWLARQIRQLITLLLVGALLMWLLPNWMRKLSDIVKEQPLPSLGWGFVSVAAFGAGMVLVVLVTLLVSLTLGFISLNGLARRVGALGGILSGTAGLSFSVMWSYITRIVISLLVGELIFQQFSPSLAEHRWWPLLLGVLIFVAVTAVPMLGWLVKLIATLFGLGAIWLWAQKQVKGTQDRVPAAEVAEAL